MDDSSAASGIDTALTYLTSIPAWYLATSVDNQPHVRPFSFAAKQDGKLWFCTATTKDVWQELLQNPLLEATAWWPGTAGLSCAAAPAWTTASPMRFARQDGNISKVWASTTMAHATPRSSSLASRTPKPGSATTTNGNPSPTNVTKSRQV